MLPGSIVCRIMCPYRVPESTAVITLVLSARGRESIAAKAHLALDGISIVLAGGCIGTFTSAGDFTNLVCERFNEARLKKKLWMWGPTQIPVIDHDWKTLELLDIGDRTPLGFVEPPSASSALPSVSSTTRGVRAG